MQEETEIIDKHALLSGKACFYNDLSHMCRSEPTNELDRLYAELEKALNLPDSSKYVNTIWDWYGHLFDNAPPEFQRFAKLFEDYFASNSTDDFDFKR